MKIKELIKESFISLSVHKLRTVLAMLGISIGIAGIAMINILTDSVGASIKQEISQFGVNHFVIYETKESLFSSSHQPGLTLSDTHDIQSLAGPINAVVPMIKQHQTISYKNKRLNGHSHYTNQAFETVLFETLSSGRFINETDLVYSRPVCVIDESIASELFPNQSGIGEKIRINNQEFYVVGITKAKERTLINWIEQKAAKPSRVIIPITYLLHRMDNPKLQSMIISVSNIDQIDTVAAKAISFLEKKHSGKSYKYHSKKREIMSFNAISFNLRWLFYAIMGIALFIGGIGVANVLTISVLERTKEIGIRKSLGATAQNIFHQFLSEALIICFLSGLFGAVIGTLIGFVTMSLYGNVVVVEVDKIGYTFLVTFIIGVVSGIIPARKASRMEIVEAIRYET